MTEQKTISVTPETWEKLSIWRIKLNSDSMDELLSKMIKMISLEELERVFQNKK